MTATTNTDRTQMVPSHDGPHVLPNNPLFTRLLRHAHRNRIALKDRQLGVSKTYGELLDAVLVFREVLREALPSKVQRRLSNGNEVYVGVLAAGGYEFTVAVLAVLALGAAVVPMFPMAPADEVVYYATKSQQVAILSTSATSQLAQDVAHRCGIVQLSILPNLPRTTRLEPHDISLSSNSPQDPREPGVVIFTSGTTGKPKGVVLRRTYTHEGAISVGDSYGVTHTDVLLHTLPVHHQTGLGTSFFPFLNAGACIEFHGKFDAATVLQRWLQGGLTVFSAVPTIYMRLKWFIEQRPEREQIPYKQSAGQFRAFLCGSSALQEHVQDFWTESMGRSILPRYGATEIPGCLRVSVDLHDAPKGSVGQAMPGVELKISPEGELLVKTPNMFAKYLMDPEATKNAHDDDGWYKTGDIARREGNFYFIVGRASVDIIKSGGYKISALDVERACLTLPYVNEAMVVGVEDEEFGQRVGAVLAVKNVNATDVSLADVREILRNQLAGYKLPTVLRVLEGELPKGNTGKVQKKILGPKLVPSPGYEQIPEVQSSYTTTNMATPTSFTVTKGPINIEALDQGTGPVIVILPSLARGANDYDVVAPILTKAGYRVIRPQPRGIGRSNGPMDKLTLHDFAADVAMVLDHINSGPSIIVGHAWGSQPARMLAVDRPDLVRGVVMAAASAGKLPPGSTEEPFSRLRTEIDGSGDMSLPESKRLEYLQAAFFGPEGNPRLWLDGWNEAAHHAQAHARMYTPVEEYFSAGETVPILDLQAEHDAVVVKDVMKPCLGDRVEVQVIKGAGHAMAPEQPEAMANAIINFVKKI
ncbi:uncharacterized protein B0J16DRAFT_353329 [Fusarium flagelliforme]|uniref:uncharacterized protein n=1 Tax=Fusarium flagelliforme TaxID=2675880 RepID=UPI001E8D2F8A|nr:uncharacterized protein B0J16DRAFT_353329 [Fusarium flagelliforme]KAH7199009.1 hypothetical protein B0J16DRAFT_353329 [Fusarium flagelliforme]